MGIQAGHHAGQCLFKELLIADRIDVEGFDGAEHVGKLPDFLQRELVLSSRISLVGPRIHSHGECESDSCADRNQL